MGIFFFFFLMFVMAFSFLRNNDLFSPSKWYLLSLGAYFNDVFFEEVSMEINFMFFCFVIVAIVFVILERKSAIKITPYKQKKVLKNQNRFFLFFILLSLIPIGTQLYFISLYGGIFNYITGISFRVNDWQGLGHLTTLLSFYPIINTILLILVLKFKIKKIWRRVFVIHFIILILLGALSGSRSATLFGFVNFLFFYNYFRNRIKIKTVLPFVIILFLSASVLAIVRNEMRVSDDEITFFKDKLEISETSIGDSYGIFTFQKLVEKPFNNYQYGLTYLTTITNFIPRVLWPGKPSSGGVIITKFIDGNNYTGTSHYSTGIISEGIINFGYYVGPVFAMILLIIIGLKIIGFYNRKLIGIKSNNYYTHQNTIIYPFILLMNTKIMGGILMGEFTAVFFDFLQTYILLYFIIFLMRVFRFKFNIILKQ
jgi:oligosaccharide repeat unit polymerase